MTSAAQMLSNRLNAQSSTGPTSQAGKLRTARNATRHGLASETLTALPNEDAAELQRMAEELRNDLAPEGALELVIADRVICAALRLRRAGVYENGVLKAESSADGDIGLAFFRDSRKGDAMAKVGRYIRECETSLRSNLNLLTLQQARRRGQAVPLPVSVDVTLASSGAGDEHAE